LISEKSLTVDDSFSFFGAHPSADLLLQLFVDDECNVPVKDIVTTNTLHNNIMHFYEYMNSHKEEFHKNITLQN